MRLEDVLKWVLVIVVVCFAFWFLLELLDRR